MDQRNGASSCWACDVRRSDRICGEICKELRQCRNEDCIFWARVMYLAWFAGHEDKMCTSRVGFGICWHKGQDCFVLGEDAGNDADNRGRGM